jgi:ribonuclease HII
MMLDYAKMYPEYGFEKHKGYGTKAHLKAIREYGPSPIHRLSFAPFNSAQLTLNL